MGIVPPVQGLSTFGAFTRPGHGTLANAIMPDVLGVDGEIILLLIIVVIIVVMAVLIVRFLNQSIEIAMQLEKEMEYSRSLEGKLKGLEADMAAGRKREEALKRYAEDAMQQLEMWGQPSQEYSNGYWTGGDYGEVEVVQSYEEIPLEALGAQEVEVQAGEARAEAEKDGQTKKRKPVVAKARVLDAPSSSGSDDKDGGFQLQDVFIIYKDGRLVSHLSKKVRIVDDSEIIGGMITAVQMCVRESFKREARGSLDEMKFGRMKILMETGKYLNLAVVLRGSGYKELRKVMRETLDVIHKAWDKELKDWDGTISNLRALEKIIQRDLLDRFDIETFHQGDSKPMDLSKAPIFSYEN